MAYKFKRAIVGGTFDHLHAGHQKLLTTAFEQAEYIVIGISTNDLFQHKTYADLIEDFATRKATVEEFLTSNQFDDRSEIVPLNDFYGTSLTDKTIEAIFVTESNSENVEKMNEERLKRSFPPLTIVIVPYVMGTDGKVISSERIRNGQIDRNGTNYLEQFQTQEIFHLRQDQRESLRIPVGNVFRTTDDVLSYLHKKHMIIAVGDVIANSLQQKNMQADISVIDGKTRRDEKIEEKIVSPAAKRWESQNDAGTIAREAVNSLQAAIQAFQQTQEKQLLMVSGEEDLLAIPAILLSPLHTIVVYGLFGKGIVAVEVSEQNKQDLHNLFRKFQ